MSNNAFVGYEYQEVSVKNGMSSVYADGYENFGWKLENSNFASGKPDSVVMTFKRDRKIRNKPQLTRLQRQSDAIASEIVSLESSICFGIMLRVYMTFLQMLSTEKQMRNFALW